MRIGEAVDQSFANGRPRAAIVCSRVAGLDPPTHPLLRDPSHAIVLKRKFLCFARQDPRTAHALEPKFGRMQTGSAKQPS